MIFIDADTIECIETTLISLSINYRWVINLPEVLGQVSIFITWQYRPVTMETKDNSVYHVSITFTKGYTDYGSLLWDAKGKS